MRERTGRSGFSFTELALTISSSFSLLALKDAYLAYCLALNELLLTFLTLTGVGLPLNFFGGD
ncbi:hypothetical protein, partial [Proteus mirabilis]|uniref:hypothetical protein n=1 Tax=Proteus mirabilis TaxID=584 RepID=UPI001ADD9DC7